MYDKNKSTDKRNGGKSKFNPKDKGSKGNYRAGNKRDANAARSGRYKEEDVKGRTEARNDTSWYGGNTEIMAQAAAISFGNALGMEPNLVPNVEGQTFKGRLTIPGIMCFNILPVFGECVDWNSPANFAARTIYSFVRHQNSGHSNYDASDLGMYIMGMDQLYCYYAWMVRLYGSMQTILTRNRYLPKPVVLAQGGDYEDLATNLADFLFYINTFATRLNALSVPNTYTLFKRHMWLFSNIYADADTDKCQMYVLRPAAFAMYNPTASDSGPALQWQKVKLNGEEAATEAMTFADIKELGDKLLNALLNDEDINIISGDILKAYGDNRFMVAGVSADYRCVPIYEPEFLLQIHNSMHVNQDVQYWPSITQDNKEGSQTLGCLKFTPFFNVHYNKGEMTPMDEYYRSDVSALAFSNVIDLTTNNVTPELIAIATRFRFTPKLIREDKSGEYYKHVRLEFHNFASELIIGAGMMHLRNHTDSGVNDETDYIPLYPNGHPVGVDRPTGFNVGQTFDSRPVMYDVRLLFDQATGNMSQYRMNGIAGSLTNFTVMEENTLSNIQLCAMQAMLGLL